MKDWNATIADHGPDWAAAVAALADRATTVFGRRGEQCCLSVVDLEPWRLLDSWWLRRELKSAAALSGQAMRYVPCEWPGGTPAALAPEWSSGAPPVKLHWPRDSDAPLCGATGKPWSPDGAVLLLAGGLPKKLAQRLLLSHHGQLQEWSGEPERQWRALEPASHAGGIDEIDESVLDYVKALPSAMLSLPVGYWRLLERVFAWARRGCIVVGRADGWSSLAQMREDAAQRAEVREASPPVNFHWLARRAPGIGAAAHMVSTSRADAIQVMAVGLPDAEVLLPQMCSALAAATRSTRTDRTRAVRALAAGGDLDAALAVLQLASNDPTLLRGTADALTAAAATANPATQARLGAWLAELMADNPWIEADTGLLRTAGHLALACGRLDVAGPALTALGGSGHALPADLTALGTCMERLGRLKAALTACDQALERMRGHPPALETRARILARVATLSSPWRIQHDLPNAPVILDPLHADHAPMLKRQMRDPSIAWMTALPALEESDDGRAWIKGRLDDGICAYAVMHRHLGFVGYLDMRLWKSTAFVCYWIGPDFQGLGLCAPALAAACDLASRNGVELLLSCAYDDNVRSLRVLYKQGFRRMDVRALPPDDERTFVMLPAAHMDEDEGLRRLIDFCDNTGSGLQFTAAGGEAAPDTPALPLEHGELL